VRRAVVAQLAQQPPGHGRQVVAACAATRRSRLAPTHTVRSPREPQSHTLTTAGTHTLTSQHQLHRTVLIPTVTGNAVRSFSTHGQQAAAEGSSTTVSRADVRLIQYLDASVRRWLLIGCFPYPLIMTRPPPPPRRELDCAGSVANRLVPELEKAAP
jgi:hypothetical protein